MKKFLKKIKKTILSAYGSSKDFIESAIYSTKTSISDYLVWNRVGKVRYGWGIIWSLLSRIVWILIVNIYYTLRFVFDVFVLSLATIPAVIYDIRRKRKLKRELNEKVKNAQNNNK